MEIIHGYCEQLAMTTLSRTSVSVSYSSQSVSSSTYETDRYYFKINGISVFREGSGYIEEGDFLIMYGCKYDDGLWRPKFIINCDKIWSNIDDKDINSVNKKYSTIEILGNGSIINGIFALCVLIVYFILGIYGLIELLMHPKDYSYGMWFVCLLGVISLPLCKFTLYATNYKNLKQKQDIIRKMLELLGRYKQGEFDYEYEYDEDDE
ncbi:hypothetical protein OFO01_05850 [Campylobacter sp. JMF_01 NE2]|uniref:hypothetical protein n=1 Tax=unclassified Campylobacter TaxID=2593542 RepID=UPI0022E9AFB0|nr:MULTISPECIES: hypothetical protein [unclassified Campylobacter]MDA3052976.1 hypothetical protein [Campylobacter sp. JMF_03 NE3]MDA3067307.1 hypothetical protein [Campylobacter sp. JMF_01 NE2]